MLMAILALYNTLTTYAYYARGVLVPLLHVVLAVAVWQDGRRRSTVLVGAPVWAGMVLLLGLPGLASYWVVHHSSLRGVGQPSTAAGAPGVAPGQGGEQVD